MIFVDQFRREFLFKKGVQFIRTKSLPAKPEFNCATEEKAKEVNKNSVKETPDSHETLTGKPSASPNTSNSKQSEQQLKNPDSKPNQKGGIG